jgi:hypothetical protein
MRVFGNMVLRKMFGAEMEEVTGDWKRLRTERLYDLYL